MGKALLHTCDSPEQIQVCLNCPYTSCWGGCTLIGCKPKKPRGSKLDKDGIGRKLLSMGLTDAQIAQYTGMHKQSVVKWRERNLLPPGCGSGKKRKGA